MALEKIESKKYILDGVEIGVLKFSIMLIDDLSSKNFASADGDPSFNSVKEVLNAIIENNSKKLDRNSYTGKFELIIED